MPNKKTRKIKKRNNQTKIKKNKSKKGKKKKYTAKGCSLKTSWQFKKILNKNKYKGLTVGIITAPLTPNKQFFQVCGDSYIASSHITWLERFGVRIIPIPWSTKKFNYYLKICNGFYFPSGGAFAGTQKEFYNCCKTFFNMAIKENDKGRYTPIWGGCMGMQQLMIIAEGNDDLEKLLQRFDSYDNLLSTLEFTKQGLNSRLLKDMTQAQITKLSKYECTLNNHYMGITPYKFKQKEKLNKFFKIISTSDDRKGRTYVSTIEAYHYPFYGVQWHPERSSEMDYFIEFFIKEMRKNPKRSKKKVKKMFTKKIDCMGYSNTLYKKCNFYWHNRTSKHNRQLCDAAQIQKNRKESNETGV